MSFYLIVGTAKYLHDHPPGDCFEYVVATPAHTINTGSEIVATSPNECQNICRKTFGCKFFQWMPNKCWLKSQRPRWTRYEWYILPNAIAGPPICTGNITLYTHKVVFLDAIQSKLSIIILHHLT